MSSTLCCLSALLLVTQAYMGSPGTHTTALYFDFNVTVPPLGSKGKGEERKGGKASIKVQCLAILPSVGSGGVKALSGTPHVADSL